jgi:lipid II:glycine glycyltransferase (peptidoglycan interpeptide bridge formation enzyme)
MLDGEWLSAGIFFNGDVVLEYHLSASTQKGRKLSATNLLIDAAIFYAKGKGKEVLYLGGGSDCMENNPLLFFKSGFSSDRLKFSIGYSIHNDREYQLLKNMYIKSSSNNNILFYR